MIPRHSALALAATLSLAATAALAGDEAKPAAPAAIEFLMPAIGAFIPSGPVIVAGKLPPGAGALELRLDGAPLADVTRSDALFSVTLTPRPGPHVLEARVGGGSPSTLTFAAGVGGQGAAPYRYHAPVLEGRCPECHAGVRRTSPRAEAETCVTCHRKLAVAFPFVHDPVREGTCLVCHDPHGSSRPAFLTADTKALCTECHGEPSAAHTEKGRSALCHLCHNPHASMNDKFLYDIVK